MKPHLGLLIGALLLGPLATANAQSWPQRPVKIIVPTGPGAATDVMARLMADSLGRGLGQAVVVENLPGAAGIPAHQNAARATPDGYTSCSPIRRGWRSIR